MQSIVIQTVEKLDFRTREAYKTLRTNLEFSGTDIRVISLTSCVPNEGKTSVSFQLAYSLAESGKRTMLVDADLRKSVLQGRYKVTKGKFGLSHYLSGQVKLDEICCSTNIPNLDIVLAGPVPPNPSELLSNEAFRAMLEKMRKDYKYVIIDTPPLGNVIDGAIVARECDGSVIVIEANAISYHFAQNVKEQLDKAGCRILGCVLNKVDMKNNSYYGKCYGKYYGRYYGRENDRSPVRREDGSVREGKKKTGNDAPQEQEAALTVHEDSFIAAEAAGEQTENKEADEKEKL